MAFALARILPRWLSPPVFPDDPDKTRRARLVDGLLLTQLAGVLVYLLAILILVPASLPRFGFVLGGQLVLILFLRWVLGRDHVRLVSWALIASLWVIMTANAAASGGVRSPGFSNHVLLVIIAGTLLGWREALGVATVSAAMGFGFAYAARAGLIPPPLNPSAFVFAGARAIYFFLTAGLLGVATRSIGEALEETRRELGERKRAEAALAESEAALKTHVVRLEELQREQAQLYRETALALEREQRLNELSRSISAALDLDTIVPNVVRLTAELVGADMGSVALIGADGETMTYPFLWNVPDRLSIGPLRRGSGLAWHVVETGAPLLLSDYGGHPRARPEWVSAGVRTAIVAPLVSGEERFGALGLFGLDENKRFSERDLAVAESVGRQAGIAIQNARLFEAEKRRVDLLTAIHETGLGLSAQLEPARLLDTIVEKAARLLDAPMGALYLLESDQRSLRLEVRYNLPHGYATERLALGEGMAGRVAQSGVAMSVDDYREWPGRVSFDKDPPYRALLSVPVLWQDRVLGVLNLLDERAARFRPEDADVVGLLAAQAAVAIANARLFEATRRQLAELTVLHAVAVAAAEATDEDALIERGISIIADTLYPDALSVAVLLYDERAGALLPHPASRGLPEGLAQRALRPDSPEPNRRGGSPELGATGVGPRRPEGDDAPRHEPGEGIAGTVARTGQPWRVSDVSRESEYIPARPEVRSEIAVPLKSGEQLIGVANVEADRVEAFREADERLLVTFAGQLASAVVRLRAESENRKLNLELEKRVAWRTAELQAVNKELEAFSYSVSHDLRAPLRSIHGFSRLLLEEHAGALDPQARHYLERLSEGARRMGQLIDDLLAFARLSRQPLKSQLVASGDLVRQALAELEPELEGREVTISIKDLPCCNADPTLLRQVFVNLLSNAMKFTRARGVARIDIGWQAEGEGVFFVRDNGAGFDMRYAHKLFGVFQRLHRAEDYDGTGVGLALAQRIVERHGGRIWAQGRVDEGATFYFTLGASPRVA